MDKFFKKLFGRKKDKAVSVSGRATDNAATIPLSDKQLDLIANSQNSHYDTQQLIVGVGQSVGKQRDHNEDSLLAITSTISGSNGNVPFGIYIVADGMGGHQYGEVASNSAIRVMAGDIMRAFHSYLFNLPTQPLQESLQEIMEAAIKNAHRTVKKDAPGGGTTATAALVLGQQVTIAHIGDSRAYAIYPDRRVETVTRDHSLVKRLEELGHLSKEDAANFPHRNVLIRALGQGEVLEADIFTIPFPQSGYLMLCSDGLWGVINDQDISRTIVEASTLHLACQNLVEAANLAGGPDNITTILIQLIG
ncbi:MAG: protein phosphatase 2C domain-containing protein [Thermodesulfovibrionales bacterium]|nr:protein phosphatase 2C domain-containing protein [Thermodesulfovibrionales bacterium]